jgi:hypothetical protein
LAGRIFAIDVPDRASIDRPARRPSLVMETDLSSVVVGYGHFRHSGFLHDQSAQLINLSRRAPTRHIELR